MHGRLLPRASRFRLLAESLVLQFKFEPDVEDLSRGSVGRWDMPKGRAVAKATIRRDKASLARGHASQTALKRFKCEPVHTRLLLIGGE